MGLSAYRRDRLGMLHHDIRTTREKVPTDR